MMIRQTLTAMLVCLGAATAAARPAPPVKFSNNEIKQCNAVANDREALRQTILASWGGYINQDAPGYLATLAPDVTRITKRTDRLQQGVEQVKADLPREWSAFERKQGKISEGMTLKQVAIRVDHRESAQTAWVTYWVDIEGGGRWGYSDQGLVSETLVRRQGQWRIAQHSESWSRNYDLETRKPGLSTVEVD